METSNEFHESYRRCRPGRRIDVGVRRRHHRSGRDVPVPDLFEMGRCLQERHRQRSELPVDRLRRRHQADRGQDRDLRRHRHAAQGRAAREGRPDSVADGDGRDRSRGQSRGREARRAGVRRRDAGQHLSRQDHQMGRCGDQEAQSEREAADRRHHRGASLRRFGHHLQLHRLPVEGERGMEEQGRRRHRRRVAHRRRRQGQ